MPLSESQQGHRKSLREKFIESGLAGFADYEIVELLLTLGSPRRDCKKQAKEAIKRFKTLGVVMEASVAELQQINGIGPHNAFGIKLVQEVAGKFLKERLIDKPIYRSSQEIFDYLYHTVVDAIASFASGIAPSKVMWLFSTHTLMVRASKANFLSSKVNSERFLLASSQNRLMSSASILAC